MTGAVSKQDLVSKLNDILAKVTKEVMRLTFFLNYGGVAATLTAFGSSSFNGKKCELVFCLYSFLFGIVFSVLMALTLWWTTASTFNLVLRASDFADIQERIKESFTRKLVWIFCLISLILFAAGITIGFIILNRI